jgi:membrane protein HdeD
MDWRVQSALSGILGVLGLFVMFNPVTVVTAAASYIPWLLLFAGGIQYLSILLRSRRLIRLIIVPAVTGTLLVHAGLSMKFGDPTTVGPISLIFVLALVLFGSGVPSCSWRHRSKSRNMSISSWVLGPCRQLSA